MTDILGNQLEPRFAEIERGANMAQGRMNSFFQGANDRFIEIQENAERFVPRYRCETSDPLRRSPGKVHRVR